MSRDDPSTLYHFSDSERPAFPGSPYTPVHSLRTRALYFLAAMVVGTGASFGNALTTVNASTIAGSLGLYAVQAATLPAVFIAFNASANLSLVKLRAKFGIPALVLTAQACYIASTIVEVLWPSYAAAVATRAINGVSTATLTTLTVYYLLQVFPVKIRPMALVVGLGMTQLSTPIARLIPVELLANDYWHGLHLFELAHGLLLFTTVAAIRLPPTDRVDTFEPLDFLSIVLFVAALIPFCQVLSLGRTVWWTDTPWIGRALVASFVLAAIAIAIELTRRNPLVQFRLIGTSGMLRFAVMAIMIRLALAEQSYGSVGFLTSGGLDNDQLHTLFTLVLIAQVVGIVVAALTLKPEHLPYQLIAASLLIAVAAALDSTSDPNTRPPQLYASQMLIGFGTSLFIGPALVTGLLKILQHRTVDYLITLIIVFSSSQNIGGLAGSALLGSLEFVYTKVHTSALTDDLVASNPNVVTRIEQGAAAYAPALPNTGEQVAAGTAQLSNAVDTQATVLAFNDIYRLLMVIALLTALAIALDHLQVRYRARAAKPAGTAA